ncbi:TadE/TadG family type IV pilus assembly protein [Desulfofundulus thermosubterraneus]|uniref:TadE-like protein n=1 Tax=Desulfofundulus thermosubterraneus DSM 16057 TaxID=1121432 RepID=A0A1M6H1R5_9FIRM|nr:TadE family protein [Desulfofundulus thermosubterraneus]SHJ16163.1 hypothetical protein SAMN02745219_01892 [Desulfofundulus thermosubterraneus DSM 16057]
MLARFLRSERGSSVIGWVLVLPVLFFFAAFGFVYFYTNQIRACAAMAAREGAREYGIQLGQVDQADAKSMAEGRALDVMIQERLLPPDAGFSNQIPPPGKRGAGISFSDDGTWARCTITYYLPNPLPAAPRLLKLFWKDQTSDEGETSDEGGWWPTHFKITVTGAAKHEYRLENLSG